jgi:Fe-S-cluster-containing dehydrogenase component
MTNCDAGHREWWRSLEERAAQLSAAARRPQPEFPFGVMPESLNRRHALQVLTATALALPMTGCDSAPDQIVPYVDLPEGLTPGIPLSFATSLLFAGYAQPILAESNEGRPTKVEGNPQHPASRGATDAFAQAAILSLYDPARSTVVLKQGQIAAWPDFVGTIANAAKDWESNEGSGLGLLTGRVTSPTFAAQIDELKRRYPRLTWYRWEAVNEDNVLRGAELSFGQRLEPRYRLDQARAIVSFDADLLGAGPWQVPHGLAFSSGRRARVGSQHLTRLHVAEPLLTLTGAMADSRAPTRRMEIGKLALALAARLGVSVEAPVLSNSERAWLDSVAQDLQDSHGRALIAVGRSQPPEVHALGNWINQKIGAHGTAVMWRMPVEADPIDHASSIAELTRNMSDGKVEALFMLCSNPVYDAPQEFKFGDALRRVPLSVHLGLHANETASACTWHLPALHELESWSDARAVDGTLGVIQPLITRLYAGRSAHEILAVLAGNLDTSDYQIVREHWRTRLVAPGFEASWRRLVQDGFADMQGQEEAPPVSEPHLPPLTAKTSLPSGFEIVFAPDESVWDGRFAENAWLQELPRPLSKEVWGNAAAIAPADATTLAIEDGDIIRIGVGTQTLELPVLIAPGQAPGTIGLKLGYGRETGVIAKNVGANAYGLRTTTSLWAVNGASIQKTGTRIGLARTQTHRSMYGRDIVRTLTLNELSHGEPQPVRDEPVTALYPTSPTGQYAWAMVIDQSTCIGCNACVAACQAENNIPVVGPEEVARGRDMHWLRVDLYFKGDAGNPDTLFQPVPCMHCEKAPCEPVCPVEASVHDSEGLNVQVYNRCVGTRFCQANCPYKVRHFNFFGYANGQEYKNLGEPIANAAHNPDVTVRARGVMEKCTYCVQRISGVRRDAEKENRTIRDGEVVPACVQACPARAIFFGDLNDSNSEVSRLRRQPHEYALLGHLGTKPRTTYLARVRDRSGNEGRS